jgi:hypothetical protein
MSSRLCLLAVVAFSWLPVACDDASSGSAVDAAADTASAPLDGGVEAPADAMDAALDVASLIDGAPDRAPDVSILCLFDASLPVLEFPDGGIGGGGDGDGGAGDAGDAGLGLAACLPCVASKCRASINACLDNCDCRVGFAGFVQCLGGGMSPLECAVGLAQLPPGVAGLAQAPLLCAYAVCGKDCGLAP